MKRYLLLAFAAWSLCAASVASAFDPISLLVLRMLRDQLISSGLEAGLDASQNGSSPASHVIKQRDLRSYVDDGFPYLEPKQRDAVYSRLVEIMKDPSNAAQRDVLLNEFVRAASASRQAHDALSTLSYAQKKAVAREAAESYRNKSAEEVRQAIEVLKTSAVPLPQDLRELMLAELASDLDRTIPR